MNAILLLAWVLVAAYIVVGNYIYVAKVVPTLRTAGMATGPALLPSQQFAHVRAYLDSLPVGAENVWFNVVLKHARALTLLVFVAAIASFFASS